MSTLFLFIVFFSSSLTVSFVDADDANPLTPKAFALRYWDKAIRNNLPKPPFILHKASPLSAVDTVKFANLAATNGLSMHLSEFCTAAHLLCFPDITKQNIEKHTNHVNSSSSPKYNIDASSFPKYRVDASNFRRYSIDSTSFPKYHVDASGFPRNSVDASSFPKYHVDASSFPKYSTDSTSFPKYRVDASGFPKYNVDTSNFPKYHVDASSFPKYSTESTSFSKYNVDASSFPKYSADASSFPKFHVEASSFPKYSADFTSFPKYDIDTSRFPNYNVDASSFPKYSVDSTSFPKYCIDSSSFLKYNTDASNFPKYHVDAFSFPKYSADLTSFPKYNVDASSFPKYSADSTSFPKYHTDASSFPKYSSDASSFPKYHVDTSRFPKYSADSTSFPKYNVDASSFPRYSVDASSFPKYRLDSSSDSLVTNWVEPGKFFREKMLKEGTVMPMPDIIDKLAERSFLPRSILSKLPFTSYELKHVFNVSDNSPMDKIIKDSVGDCERAPNKGEIKRCVGSVEDMIDFATSILGRDIAVRTTENVNGSKKNVMVGTVRGINGGRITKSISCHQSLFPYLLYYCHSVPKVRLYEADLLDPSSKAKINHGVAICHVNTSTWSANHGAFLALGSGPGQIEVCHWIFENDLAWVIAD